MKSLTHLLHLVQTLTSQHVTCDTTSSHCNLVPINTLIQTSTCPYSCALGSNSASALERQKA